MGEKSAGARGKDLPGAKMGKKSADWSGKEPNGAKTRVFSAGSPTNQWESRIGRVMSQSQNSW